MIFSNLVFRETFIENTVVLCDQEKKNLARHEMFHRSISKFSKPENEGEKENYKEVICRERNNLYCY